MCGFFGYIKIARMWRSQTAVSAAGIKHMNGVYWNMKKIASIVMSILVACSVWPALSETAVPMDPSAAFAAAVQNETPEELLQQWYQIGALLRERGNYPYVELRKGDTGYEVKALQTRLAELGFYKKDVVDNFGSGTYAAMRLFEKANQLTVDGAASVSDQQALFSSGAVGAGAAGASPSSGGNDTVSGATKKNSR